MEPFGSPGSNQRNDSPVRLTRCIRVWSGTSSVKKKQEMNGVVINFFERPRQTYYSNGPVSMPFLLELLAC